MSATNRGTERKPHDFYATPIECVENFLNKYGGVINGNVLEPSAGNGNIVKVLRNTYKDINITSCEIREEEYNNLSQYSYEIIIDDFLTRDFGDSKFNVIIGNPPYSLAIEFVKKCLDLLEEDGVLIFLLRTAFLESKSRYEFWQENPLSGLYTLSKRPSFTGKGSDATSYSWFIWRKNSTNQEIKVI